MPKRNIVKNDFEPFQRIIEIANAAIEPAMIPTIKVMVHITKPQELFDGSRELIAVLPKEPVYKELIQDSIQQLNLASKHVEELRSEMNRLAFISIINFSVIFIWDPRFPVKIRINNISPLSSINYLFQ